MSSKPRYQEDNDTGIKREIIDNYCESSELPGATIIPSHKGKYGAQLGKEKRKPIPMVIDPEYPDSVIITPDKLDDKSAVHSAATCGNASKAYQQLANNKEGNKPVTQKNTKKATSTSTNKTLVSKKKSVTKSKSVPETTPLEPVSEPVSELDEKVDHRSTIQPIRSPALPVADLRTMIREYVSECMDAISSQEPLEGTEDSAESLKPVEPEVEAPKVQVTLSKEGVAPIALRFHRVIVEKGIVVFLYDTRFTYGDRMYPLADLNNPYNISVRDSEGEISNIVGLYMDLVFHFQHWEFQVVVAENATVE